MTLSENQIPITLTRSHTFVCGWREAYKYMQCILYTISRKDLRNGWRLVMQ